MEFFNILTKPEETMKKLLPKANLNEALKTFAIYGAILGFLIGLVFAVSSAVFAPILGAATSNPAIGMLAGFGILAIIVGPIAGAILAVIGSAISYGILQFFAKLLGGKGTFEQTFYLASKLVWPVFVAGIIATVVGTILAFVFIGFLVILAFELYMIYVIATLLAVSNKTSKLKALAAIIIAVISVLAIIAVLAVIAGLLIASTIVY